MTRNSNEGHKWPKLNYTVEGVKIKPHNQLKKDPHSTTHQQDTTQDHFETPHQQQIRQK